LKSLKLTSVCFSQSALSNIKVPKSIGPDNITYWLLKKHRYSLCYPICHIFNVSIQEGFVPMLWKCADVIPIPEESVIRCAEEDLRPNSLTKMLESFVCNWLWGQNRMMFMHNEYQHYFFSK
jgi:hypothetical protein